MPRGTGAATAEEAEIVAAVVQDLRRSRGAMDSVLTSHDRGRLAFDVFLAASPADLDAITEDSATFLIDGIAGISTLNLFDGAIRGTNLSRIADLRLRNALADWTGLAADQVGGGLSLSTSFGRCGKARLGHIRS